MGVLLGKSVAYLNLHLHAVWIGMLYVVLQKRCDNILFVILSRFIVLYSTH